MKRLYLFMIAFLGVVGSITVSAQSIPPGLIRLKSDRTSWYLSTASAGNAATTTENVNKLDQVWILQTNGSGYSLRSANTGEYLQATMTETGSGKATLYIRKSPNATSSKELYNISAKSDCSGDFLNTNSYKSELMELSGWGAQSANNFCNEIERIKSKPITHGEFLGAMGIPGISTKKCKTLFAAVDYDKFMKLVHEGKYNRADEPLYNVKGFSVKTIETFMDFIRNNIGLIDKLSESFTLVKDKRSEANIVFTGFRDAEAEKYISRKGIDVSDNINSQTIAVISGNKSSGKTKKAIERNIPVFDAYSAPITEICDYIISNLA